MLYDHRRIGSPLTHYEEPPCVCSLSPLRCRRRPSAGASPPPAHAADDKEEVAKLLDEVESAYQGEEVQGGDRPGRRRRRSSTRRTRRRRSWPARTPVAPAERGGREGVHRRSSHSSRRRFAAYDRRGDAYLKLGKFKEAIADFDEFLEGATRSSPRTTGGAASPSTTPAGSRTASSSSTCTAR